MGDQLDGRLQLYSLRDQDANFNRDTSCGDAGRVLDAVGFDGRKTATDSNLGEGPESHSALRVPRMAGLPVKFCDE